MSHPQESYKAFWNEKATTYTGALIAVDGSSDERAVLATGEHSASQVSAALKLDQNAKVLEIGCGVGRIGLPLLSKVAHWHGSDISENMLKVTRERLAAHPNFDVSPLLRTKLPFADASFEAVYSVAVFIHMDKEDFYLYLKEAARVLKPGGRLYFDHWNLTHPVGFKRFWYEANQHDLHGDPKERKDVARNQFSTPDEIRAYLSAVGLHETLVMGDTPWVQACAIKLDPAQDDQQINREKQRLSALYDTINYGQAWSRYFAWVLPFVYEAKHPRDVLAQLAGEPDTQIREMFATWLRSAWKANPAAYGPSPE